MFPKLSDAKVTAGVFIGPQVKQMFTSEVLENKMTVIEKRAWLASKHVVAGFFGNTKAENYRDYVEELLDSYHALGCRISPKPHSHLDFFQPNLGAVSKEHIKRFHQDIQLIQKRYQGRWDKAMMGTTSGTWSVKTAVHIKDRKEAVYTFEACVDLIDSVLVTVDV
jgi:hypothetical protein